MAADAELPAVSLDFGGAAWDDRELVNAYDAALLEFHIHNPGPGSWLDKATAALAKGQQLPGANAFGTEWYAAAKRQVDAAAATEAEAAASKAAAQEGTKSKKKKAEGPLKKKQRTEERYTPSGAVDSPKSPRYTPPSPRDADMEEEVVDEGEGEVEGEEEEEEEYDGAPEWDGHIGNYDSNPYDANSYTANANYTANADAEEDPGLIFPPPSGEWQPPAPVTRDEAIGYALHAQYWAGYWMGVARGIGRGQPGSGAGKKRGGGQQGSSRNANDGGGGTPAWASRRGGTGAGAGLRR